MSDCGTIPTMVTRTTMVGWVVVVGVVDVGVATTSTMGRLDVDVHTAVTNDDGGCCWR